MIGSRAAAQRATSPAGNESVGPSTAPSPAKRATSPATATKVPSRARPSAAPPAPGGRASHASVPAVLEIVTHGDFVAAVDAATTGGAVAIALTDLDGFGPLNQELGHEAGNRVLAVWSKTLIGSLPKTAIVRRLGGDEFAIALPNDSSENALIVLHEIRSHLASRTVEGVGRTITATFGVASRPPHAIATEDLIRCADAALMRGKREGGDRVALFVEEKMVLKSNYYSRADLDRLGRIASATDRTEASLLREALADLFAKYRTE